MLYIVQCLLPAYGVHFTNENAKFLSEQFPVLLAPYSSNLLYTLCQLPVLKNTLFCTYLLHSNAFFQFVWLKVLKVRIILVLECSGRYSTVHTVYYGVLKSKFF